MRKALLAAIVAALILRRRPTRPATPATSSPTPRADPAAKASVDGDATRESGPGATPRPRPAVIAVAALATLALVGVAAISVTAGATWAGLRLRDPIIATVTPVTGATIDWADTADTLTPAIAQVSTPNGGTGTGFYTANDRIVTAAHVLGADTSSDIHRLVAQLHPSVRTWDGHTLRARVVGIDPRADIAVLDVPPVDSTRIVRFADMRTVNTGDPVATIGYPLGESAMLTTGVVSGMITGSQFASDSAQNWLIQSDVPVNPGNSGGPLFTPAGNVAGMVVLRPDTSEGRPITGLTLAVPSSLIVPVVNRLERGQDVGYVKLGVTVRDNYADTPGVTVVSVAKDSPAERIGITAGDIITTLNDHVVDSTDDLFRLLPSYAPGDTVTLTVVHDGGTPTPTTVTFGAR